MIAFPSMLASAAAEAGMKVPEDPDAFDPEEFPHFAVFCKAQLGAPMPSPDSHWENAKVVAAIPADKIMSVTMAELRATGFAVGFSSH